MFTDSFQKRHKLPDSYLTQAKIHFDPVAEALIKLRSEERGSLATGRTLIIGINGSQGSGKTTLADYLTVYLTEAGLSVLNLSLDDFYLSRMQRMELSKTVHPMLATRGVPGTHDTDALACVLNELRSGKTGALIPRFDKAIDDLIPRFDFDVIDKQYDVVLLEGWCWGAMASADDELIEPMNKLERERDSTGEWRRYVNKSIIEHYVPLYDLVDCWMMLKAPSFDCVFRWRLEQETKLNEKLNESGKQLPNSNLMNESDIAEFVQFFERITRRLLDELPGKCDVVWELDDHRRIVSAINRLDKLGINKLQDGEKDKVEN